MEERKKYLEEMMENFEINEKNQNGFIIEENINIKENLMGMTDGFEINENHSDPDEDSKQTYNNSFMEDTNKSQFDFNQDLSGTRSISESDNDQDEYNTARENDLLPQERYELMEKNLSETPRKLTNDESEEENNYKNIEKHVATKPINKSKFQTRENIREKNAIKILTGGCNENDIDIPEKFLEQNIAYKDLSSLTEDDLKFLGIGNEEKQTELLETFKQLPKQATDYAKITNSIKTETCNNEILKSTISHLDTMTKALLTANLKLKSVPMEDEIYDEEDYASNLIIQTLDELRKITDELDDRISNLEDINDEKLNDKTRSFFDFPTIITGVAAATLLCYIWSKLG